MTVRVSKPEFNLREKITELDFDRVPYEKMPAGSVIQVYSLDTHNDYQGSVSGGSGFVDPGEGYLFETLSFCPMFDTSKILLQSTNVTIYEYTNDTDTMFMSAYVKNDASGTGVVHAIVQGNMGYEIFNNYKNGQVLCFNNIIPASEFGGKTSDIDIRLGSVAQSTANMRINRDSYSSSIANNRNVVTFTIMEIKQ